MVKSITIGAIEGTLEVMQGISGYFTIVDRASGRRIRCDCAPELLDEIAGRQLWRRMLVVTGEIQEDRSGHPKTLKVSGYRPLQSGDELPQPEDLLGLYRTVAQ